MSTIMRRAAVVFVVGASAIGVLAGVGNAAPAEKGGCPPSFSPAPSSANRAVDKNGIDGICVQNNTNNTASQTQGPNYIDNNARAH
jgi:hypothetical protein